MSKGGNQIKETPEQKYLAKVAAEKWNFAQDKLAPLEDKYMASVEQIDSPQKMSYIRGRTMQGQNQGLTETQNALGKRMAANGIDPSSGRATGSENGLALDVAKSGGDTLGRAQFEQGNQKIMGLQNVTAIGQGQSGQAQAGLSGVAQQSSSNAINSATKAFNRRSANLQLLGTVAGAGTRYGMETGAFSSPPADQYGMDTNFDTSPNNFGLNDSTGGYYDFARAQ